jgi:hypothetical protein
VGGHLIQGQLILATVFFNEWGPWVAILVVSQTKKQNPSVKTNVYSSFDSLILFFKSLFWPTIGFRTNPENDPNIIIRIQIEKSNSLDESGC